MDQGPYAMRLRMVSKGFCVPLVSRKLSWACRWEPHGLDSTTMALPGAANGIDQSPYTMRLQPPFVSEGLCEPKS